MFLLWWLLCNFFLGQIALVESGVNTSSWNNGMRFYTHKFLMPINKWKVCHSYNEALMAGGCLYKSTWAQLMLISNPPIMHILFWVALKTPIKYTWEVHYTRRWIGSSCFHMLKYISEAIKELLYFSGESLLEKGAFSVFSRLAFVRSIIKCSQL